MWIAVSTHPNRERLAIDNLLRQGYETYCPYVSKIIRHARKTEYTKRPLFPGYIFVFLNEKTQGFRPIGHTYGVRGLVRFGNTPARLPAGFIDQLRAREIDGKIPQPPLNEVFPNGTIVSIKSGPFKDLMARVLSSKPQDRIIVLLDFLKQSVRAEIYAEHLEKA